MIKISVIFASALGLTFAESGMAFNFEQERPNTSTIRLAYNSAPYQHIKVIRNIHRPTRSRADESESENEALAVHSRSSGVRFRGLKRAFPYRISPPGVRLFIFSPRDKAWAAYLPNGKLVGYGRASGGANWCRDVGRPCRTPRGKFRVYSLGLPSCRSSRYPKPKGGAPMPYCMFFSKYYAIHGSPHVPNYNASHGCIRVKPKAAKWLRYHFITIGTRVVVTSY